MRFIPYTVHEDGSIEYRNANTQCIETMYPGSYQYINFIPDQLEAGNIMWYIHPALWHFEAPIIDGSHITEEWKSLKDWKEQAG